MVIEETKLGLFADIPEEVYRPMPGLNASTMAYADQSMAHMKHQIDNPEDSSTPAKDLGTLVHLLALQPEKFDERYLAQPDWDARTTVGKAIRDEFNASRGTRKGVDAETLANAQAIVAALKAHPLAGKMLAAPGPCEVVARWKDPKTGILCKGRLDKYIPGKLALDLKTTADASPAAFASSYYKYGYHRQLAHYIDGYALASGEAETPFAIIAVENVAPYGVCVFQPDEASLTYGRFDNRRIIDQYAACLKSGVWPCYPNTVRTIGVPDWASKRYETEISMSERMNSL